MGVNTFRILMETLLLGIAIVTAAPKTPGNFNVLREVSGCQGKPAELLFLLDSSSSIWSVDFKKQLQFVSEIVEKFEINENRTRVGVSSFSYTYRSNFGLGMYDNVKDIQEAIADIPQYLGGTYTYDALDGIRTSALAKDVVRPGVVKIVVVLTDGKSYNIRKTKVAAKKLKEDAIVFAVGIGSGTDREELTAIASEPTDQFLFQVGNYDLLATIKQQLTDAACEAELRDAAAAGPACGASNPADVMFLFDIAQVGAAHSTELFEFIGEVSSEFNMEPDNIQVGVESSYCGTGSINLGDYSDTTDLSSALRNTKVSSMSHMIRRLRTHSFEKINGGRPKARHMAVIIVDDKLFDPKDVLDQARRTKHYDVELFVVAIGDSVVETELALLASTPLDRHLIRVPSYSDLALTKPEFLKKFCHGL